MSTYATTRRVRLESLAFPATMRGGGTSWEYEADQTSAALKAAVDAAPLDARDTNEADLRTKAVAALTTNATYLALASPSAAQNTAQIKALTRENNALIRLMLGLLDTTTGT